ncbi:MAG TPA: hypothetical protein GX717_05965 [Clostridiaceae bacterium]|nr:hypothetical protein [Clostridiaceae bacterium]
MKKILSLILASFLILGLVGCGGEEAPENSNVLNDSASSALKAVETASDIKTLPDSYPKDVLPLAADAEIIDVRENPASKGLEVMYVSDNDIDTLCDFYVGALKDAKDLSTDETPDGYWITAKMDGIDYTVMLDKNAMNPTKYAGQISVYLVLSGLEGAADPAEKPEGESLAWPFAEMPGVPELKGHISKILREDGIMHFEMTVESDETIKS